MNKKIELLAPAGDYAAFLAAVENGADAVYLGGKLLNARQSADNFDNEELERALDYAHLRSAKVYLTLNTLVLDTEMQEAVEYAGKAFEMGTDAFIVQDAGLASNLKKAIPDIQIHASTQMTAYSAEGIKELEAMGFSRVVLARELSLKEISDICGNTPLEVEVFVHGALCISYSGQCLMSSIIGGRSGNRGKCAQPCRLPYSIYKDNKNLGSGHLLSPKDICYIENIAGLKNAGVSSLKIEGRMKNPEYVASVVGIYRKYLDGLEQNSEYEKQEKVSQRDMHLLLQSFNRGGFSKGYLLDKTGPDMMCYEKPKNWGVPLGTVLDRDQVSNAVKIRLDASLGNGDGIEIWSNGLYEDSPGGIITKIVKDKQLVKRAHKGDIVWVSVIKGKVQKGSSVYKTSDKEMLEQAALSFAKSTRKTDVSADFILKAGRLPILKLSDNCGNAVMAEGELIPEKALNKPLSNERAAEQLKKTGATPFNISELRLDIDADITIPVSELNNIRRTATSLLENKIVLSYKKKISGNAANFQKYLPGNSHLKNKKVKISVMLWDISDDIELEKISADRIYIPFLRMLDVKVKKAVDSLRNQGKEIFAYIPAVIRGKCSELLKKSAVDMAPYIDGFLVGNMAAIQILRDQLGKDIRLTGDFTLNILNSSTLQFYKDSGFSGAMLSYELNISQINSLRIAEEFEAEVGVYGKIPVMTSEYCPVGGSIGNNKPDKCGAVCKNGTYHLKDRRNAEFPVKCDCLDCRSTIFNSNVLFAPEMMDQIVKTGVDYIRLSFVDEAPGEIYDIVDLHRSIIENRNYKNKDRVIEHIKAAGYTKGHLQRGV
jgi:putative protease